MDCNPEGSPDHDLISNVTGSDNPGRPHARATRDNSPRAVSVLSRFSKIFARSALLRVSPSNSVSAPAIQRLTCANSQNIFAAT
jgi:hypothetical protein